MSTTLSMFNRSTATKRLLFITAAALLGIGAYHVRPQIDAAYKSFKNYRALMPIKKAIADKDYVKAKSLLDETKRHADKDNAKAPSSLNETKQYVPLNQIDQLVEEVQQIHPHDRFEKAFKETKDELERFKIFVNIAPQYAAIREQDKKFNKAFVNVSVDRLVKKFENDGYLGNYTKESVEKFIKNYALIADSESLAVLRKALDERLFASMLKAEIKCRDSDRNSMTNVLPYLAAYMPLFDVMPPAKKQEMRQKTIDAFASRTKEILEGTSIMGEAKLNSFAALLAVEQKYGLKSNIDVNQTLLHAFNVSDADKFMKYSLPNLAPVTFGKAK